MGNLFILTYQSFETMLYIFMVFSDNFLEHSLVVILEGQVIEAYIFWSKLKNYSWTQLPGQTVHNLVALLDGQLGQVTQLLDMCVRIIRSFWVQLFKSLCIVFHVLWQWG